jgi:hypothetical protein
MQMPETTKSLDLDQQILDAEFSKIEDALCSLKRRDNESVSREWRQRRTHDPTTSSMSVEGTQECLCEWIICGEGASVADGLEQG